MDEMISVKQLNNFRQIIPLEKSKLKVLGDSTRLQILQLLIEEPMSIGDLEQELLDMGIKKSTNTIRHHVDVLKKAGFVSLIGLKESRGGVLKYYQSNSQILDHGFPDEKLGLLQKISQNLSDRFDKLISDIIEEYSTEIDQIAKSLIPCQKCDASHFRDHIIMQIILNGINNSLTNNKVS